MKACELWFFGWLKGLHVYLDLLFGRVCIVQQLLIDAHGVDQDLGQDRSQLVVVVGLGLKDVLHLLGRERVQSLVMVELLFGLVLGGVQELCHRLGIVHLLAIEILNDSEGHGCHLLFITVSLGGFCLFYIVLFYVLRRLLHHMIL